MWMDWWGGLSHLLDESYFIKYVIFENGLHLFEVILTLLATEMTGNFFQYICMQDADFWLQTAIKNSVPHVKKNGEQ